MKRIATASCATVAAAIALLLFGASARAADWRIQTKVYEEDARRPSCETTTYFYEGKVYDVLSAPAETTIFDPVAGKFTVVDPTRKWRTEVSTSELAELTKRLSAAAARKSDPLMRFAAEPKFETSWSATKKELTCHSALLSYEIRTEEAPSAEVATQYQTFADWYARLNAVQPGRVPPNARIMVNDELHRRRQVPIAVRLVLTTDAASKKESVRRSEHETTWKLSEGDIRQIQAAESLAASCDAVTFPRFYKIDAMQTADRR
jgi:hypothetical protein